MACLEVSRIIFHLASFVEGMAALTSLVFVEFIVCVLFLEISCYLMAGVLLPNLRRWH